MHTLRAAFSCALAALLSCAMATAAVATEPAPAPPAEQLQELDQIVVRGESLIKAIADAEDTFYDLFNKLNTDDKYDTHCVYLNIDPDNAGSQRKSRVCIPGFVADAMADQASFAAACLPEFSTFDTDGNGRITLREAQTSQDLFSLFSTLDDTHDGSLSIGEYLHWAQWSTANCYHPPPPQLVLMEGSKAWAVQMMKVINSDPRLKDQAGHLDDLYRELRSVQLKYSKAVDDTKPVKTTRRELGPRAR